MWTLQKCRFFVEITQGVFFNNKSEMHFLKFFFNLSKSYLIKNLELYVHNLFDYLSVFDSVRICLSHKL